MQLTTLEITLRIGISFLLGGLIGIERERLGRPAGFRTHILVSLGSTLIMIVSAYGFEPTHGLGGYDPGRIAAQVVSGIGFLGAGTIMREGINVQGLTTAASIWTVSGIGLAVGAGLYYPATIVTILVVVTLVVLQQAELVVRGKNSRLLKIRTIDTPGQLARIFSVLAKYQVNVRNIVLESDESGIAQVTLTVRKATGRNIDGLLSDLMSTSGISQASIE